MALRHPKGPRFEGSALWLKQLLPQEREGADLFPISPASPETFLQPPISGTSRRRRELDFSFGLTHSFIHLFNKYSLGL